MGKHLVDPVVVIDGDDFSNHFRSATINAEFAVVPTTGFGAEFEEEIPGTGTATIDLEAFQDFAANELHQNLWPIFRNKTIVEVTVKPFDAPVSATNPEFSFPEARLFVYNPIDGSKGDASTTPLTFRNAGQQGLVQSFT